MYIAKSLIEGLNILGFDKDTIKKVSKEKSLEEIFLSTLFLNYLIVLLVYLVGLLLGGYSIEGRELNMPVIFGLLMIYPFTYNLLVYGIYGFFGLMAEMLDKKAHVKPLISVGFHTGIVYAIIFYIIAMLSTFNASYGIIVSGLFLLYFLYTMFLSISTIYNFSLSQTLIVVFIPFLLLGIGLLLLFILVPSTMDRILQSLFI